MLKIFSLCSKSPESIDIFYRKSERISPNLHQQIELIFVLEGTLDLGIDSKLYSMRKGDLALIFPGQFHYAQFPEHREISGQASARF